MCHKIQYNCFNTNLHGPALSKQMQLRLMALERHFFSVGQVLAFRGFAAALAKSSLLALQRRLRLEREKQRVARERRVLDERRRWRRRRGAWRSKP